MNSVAHPLLQKQWSTSASKPLEKLILAANGQFHAAKSIFSAGKVEFFILTVATQQLTTM